MRYRKKPALVAAFQFDGTIESIDPIRQFDIKNKIEFEGKYLSIKNTESVLYAGIGDWVLVNIKGEVYPCDPELFSLTYEPVDDAITEDAVDKIMHELKLKSEVVSISLWYVDPDDIRAAIKKVLA